MNQTQLYNARKRRRGLQDPSSVLFRTHVFAITDTDIETGLVFGDEMSRSKAVTFAFILSRSGAGSGVVLCFGSANRGIAVWSNGADIGVAAGAGSGDDGLDFVVTDALPVVNSFFKFVLSVNPGNGSVKLHRNGHVVGGGIAANESLNGAWADFDAATGILTLTGNAVDGETVTIGSKVYTFQDTLTDVNGNVKVGASASVSLDNLIAAINLGAGAGTLYATATTLHPTVIASAGAGDTMNLTAKTKGTDGNSIATTTTLADGSFAEVTLTGGKDGHGAIGGVADEVNDRVPGGSRAALENVAIIGGVSVYLHQRAGA
jgi:hypothetical protein